MSNWALVLWGSAGVGVSIGGEIGGVSQCVRMNEWNRVLIMGLRIFSFQSGMGHGEGSLGMKKVIVKQAHLSQGVQVQVEGILSAPPASASGLPDEFTEPGREKSQ